MLYTIALTDTTIRHIASIKFQGGAAANLEPELRFTKDRSKALKFDTAAEAGSMVLLLPARCHFKVLRKVQSKSKK